MCNFRFHFALFEDRVWTVIGNNSLSTSVEKKSCKKADFLGAIILFAGSVNASLNIYICPKVLKNLGPICLQLFIFKSQRAYML